MSNFFTQIAEHAVFALEFAGIVFLFFLVAYVFEKIAKKKNGDTERILNTRTIAVIGMFSAIATILFLFEFTVPFAPPGIYKLDFSELPALIGGFAFGPVAGVMIEFLKVLLKTLIKGTSTAFVGELANFVIGASFVLPASIIYRMKKTKVNALISCIVGTILITIVGSAFNGIYLLPTFAAMFGMDMDSIIGMGTAVNSHITDVTTFVCFAVAPLNLLKGAANSVITLFIYKPLSPIIKGNRH